MATTISFAHTFAAVTSIVSTWWDDNFNAINTWINAVWGQPNGLATLDASSKVSQDPANATATPTASKIPIADGDGKIGSGWIDSMTDGTNAIKIKIINIGDWNMDTTANVSIAHGIADYKKIRGINIVIRADDDISYNNFPSWGGGAADGAGNSFTTNFVLYRATGGAYDGNAYDSTSFNRGWICIHYVE